MGTILARSMLQRYGLKEGDRVHLVETPCGILVVPFGPEFAEAMEVYAEGSAAYRTAMRELAD